MSLFQAIEHGKEHRKHYKGYLYCNGWVMSCENHNPKHKQCTWCRNNRIYSNKKREFAALQKIKEAV